MKIFILFLSFILSSASFAAQIIQIKQDFQLPNYDVASNSYWVQYSFTEEKPGVISDDLLAHGCTLQLFSSIKIFLAGNYNVTYKYETPPSPPWDLRARITLSSASLRREVTVGCQTKKSSAKPISNRYINRLGGSYFSVQ